MRCGISSIVLEAESDDLFASIRNILPESHSNHYLKRSAAAFAQSSWRHEVLFFRSFSLIGIGQNSRHFGASPDLPSLSAACGLDDPVGLHGPDIIHAGAIGNEEDSAVRPPAWLKVREFAVGQIGKTRTVERDHPDVRELRMIRILFVRIDDGGERDHFPVGAPRRVHGSSVGGAGDFSGAAAFAVFNVDRPHAEESAAALTRLLIHNLVLCRVGGPRRKQAVPDELTLDGVGEFGDPKFPAA